MSGKVSALLNTGVPFGGEVGGDTLCPMVGEEVCILRNLGMGGDSLFGVGAPAEWFPRTEPEESRLERVDTGV